MKKEIICTVCPIGCHIMVEGDADNVTSIVGYGCKRGENYAASEFIHPERILTSTVRTDSARIPLVPVRSDRPVPKEKLMECMDEIRSCVARTPVRIHDILIQDICGTGANIVATGDVL